MKSIYYKFLYRPLMRFAHLHDWHHMKISHPDGDTLRCCHWCGLRVAEQRSKPSFVVTKIDEDAKTVHLSPPPPDFAVTGKPLRPSWRIRKRELEQAARTKRKKLESFQEIA